METKALVILIMSLALYLWLCDKMKTPEFNNDATSLVGKLVNQNVTHSFLDWSISRTTQLAGWAAVSFGYILNMFPVSISKLNY
jgi:hypothetical protein